MNYDQLVAMEAEFSKHFPACYGYADNGVYLMFRNRGESFDKSNAIVTVKWAPNEL